MVELALMDYESGWVQQLHLGALRNNSTRMFNTLGRDIGCDSMGDLEIARPLSKFLDRLDKGNKLPKTILYNLNPKDNALCAGRLRTGKNAIRLSVVVPRPKGWNDRANERAVEYGPAEPIRRHVDRFAKFPVLSKTRIFP